MSFANSSSGKGQFVCVDGGEEDSAEREESGATGTSYVLMYIMLWALGPITLLVQHTYTCTALYLYRTLMPPI